MKGFHHIAIRVKNFDETVRFYRDGLGLKERLAWGEGDERAMLLDAGNGNGIEVFAGGQEAPAEGTIAHFALLTEDCDGALRRAEEAGATVTVPPKSVDIPAETGPVPVRIAFVRAPGGETIEFYQNLKSGE